MGKLTLILVTAVLLAAPAFADSTTATLTLTTTNFASHTLPAWDGFVTVGGSTYTASASHLTIGPNLTGRIKIGSGRNSVVLGVVVEPYSWGLGKSGSFTVVGGTGKLKTAFAKGTTNGSGRLSAIGSVSHHNVKLTLSFFDIFVE